MSARVATPVGSEELLALLACAGCGQAKPSYVVCVASHELCEDCFRARSARPDRACKSCAEPLEWVARAAFRTNVLLARAGVCTAAAPPVVASSLEED